MPHIIKCVFADSQGRGICLLIFWVFVRERRKSSEGKDRDRSVFNSGVMECERSGKGLNSKAALIVE